MGLKGEVWCIGVMQLGPVKHRLRSHSAVADSFFVEAHTDSLRSSVGEVQRVEAGVVGVGNVVRSDHEALINLHPLPLVHVGCHDISAVHGQNSLVFCLILSGVRPGVFI